MGWKTNALLAIGACAGLAAAYYTIQLPAFFRKMFKKKTASKKNTSQVEVLNKLDEDFSDETYKRYTTLESGAVTPETDNIWDENMSDLDSDPSEATPGEYLLEQSMDKTDEDEWETCPFEDIPELHKRFNVCETLGSGTFGTVKLGVDVMTEELVAIKSIKKYANLSNIRREIEALQNLRHQHVYQLYETFETANHIYLLLEFCSNGDLFDYIEFHDNLSEKEARRILRQILSALKYIHSKGYVHRDLKPENIMMDDDDNIKLIDFGICAKPEGGLGTPLHDHGGTNYYMAPEVFYTKPYFGAEADVWSVGIILYHMLCGIVPFKGNDDDNDYHEDGLSSLYEQITSGYFPVPEYLSDKSEQLLQRMLEVQPHHRIKVDQLLHHEWVNKGYDEPVEWNSKTA